MKRRISLLLSALLLIAALLSGCAANISKEAAAEIAWDTPMTETVAEESIGFDSSTPAASVLMDSRKLITTTSIAVEAADFQGYVDALEAAVARHHGYVEASELSGTSSRRARYTLRIPAGETAAFLASLEGKGVITGKSTSVEDVTLTYADTEGRLKALRTQEESLLRLLEQAASVEDLMAVESRLSEVRYEIESWESQLRLYDNLVDYAAIHITLTEVAREQPAVEESAGTWAQIGHNLKENLYSLGEFFRTAFVAVVSALPYLLLAGLVIFVILFFALILPRRRRRKAKKAE